MPPAPVSTSPIWLPIPSAFARWMAAWAVPSARRYNAPILGGAGDLRRRGLELRGARAFHAAIDSDPRRAPSSCCWFFDHPPSEARGRQRVRRTGERVLSPLPPV